tara:strand:+ start:6305 stop:6802 length:498 start_codon:yes stop_codon:yes gene_type:complete
MKKETEKKKPKVQNKESIKRFHERNPGYNKKIYKKGATKRLIANFFEIKDEILSRTWSDIDERYSVSDDGLLLDNRFVKIRKGSVTKQGYIIVSLYQKTYYLHRLVGKEFVKNPNNYNEINHLDGDKANNDFSNLEWCTRSENILHSFHVLGKESNLKGWGKKRK